METIAGAIFFLAVAVVLSAAHIAEILAKISAKMNIHVEVLETGLDNIQHNMRS